MATKPTVSTVSSDAKWTTTTINAAFTALKDAFANVLGTDGTSGSNNTMTGDLDMDGNTIRNATFDGDIVGLDWQGAWTTATDYAVNDLIFDTDTSYICVEDHTSGTFATDLSAGKWEVFASGGASVTAYMETVLDDATASDARTTLGVAIGTDVQAYDAVLDDLSGISFVTGDVLYYNGSNLVRLAKGTAFQGLVMNSGATAPSWISEQRVVQEAYTSDGTVATGTTVFSDSPTSTSGDEYITLSITPTNASNILIIESQCHFSSSASGNVKIGMGLFQDATSTPLTVTAHNDISTSSLNCFTLVHRMVAGTASSTTFKIRAGAANAGTTTFNGISGSVSYSGYLNSYIKITELRV